MGMVFNLAPYATTQLDRLIPRSTILDLDTVNGIFQIELNKTTHPHDLGQYKTDSQIWLEHIQKDVLPTLNSHFKGVRNV